MKQEHRGDKGDKGDSAAFGRLCVETFSIASPVHGGYSAAFGRLCVETMIDILMSINANQPPSGGCVLKQKVTIWVRSWF